MKNRTRFQYAILNSKISLLVYVLKLLFLFINRTIFLNILGIKILGITNLTNSVIGVLGLAELGVGTAITYALYKPIADGNNHKIDAYLTVYRKIYKTVALFILLFGAIFFPFLGYFTSENIYDYSFYSVYFLLLINSSIGYMTFAYKRSLLEAKQEKYKVVISDFFIYSIFSIIKWILLYVTEDYTLFLILSIVSTFVSNLSISYMADKNSFLELNRYSLDKEEKRELKKNIIGGFTNRLASIAVVSTDNLLISKFLGISEVGLYGNYALIVSNLTIVISQLTESHTASIGNLILTSDSDKILSVFKRYHFLNFILVYFVSLLVLALISPFIYIWLGPNFVLAKEISILVAIYLFVASYRNSFMLFLGGYGLYWRQKNRAILEAMANLSFSLLFILIFQKGMSGVLLGTICSNVFVNLWYEPYILYKYGLKQSLFSYFKIFLKQIIIYSITFVLITYININIYSMRDLILFTFVLLFLLIIPIFIGFYRSDELNYLFNLIGRFLTRVFKRHNKIFE